MGFAGADAATAASGAADIFLLLLLLLPCAGVTPTPPWALLEQMQ
jgi:hypothetical protein